MNKPKEENLLNQRYDNLFEKKGWKALDEESFLNALIALESAWKIRLFRTLLWDKSNQEVREYLNTKWRKEWEKIVSKEYLWKSMTIVDIINQYSKMIKDTFKTKPTKEALNELWIQSDKLDGVILPSEWNQRIRPWTSEWWEESEEKKKLKFKEYQEKIETLFSDILTVENGVHPWDLEVFEWKNEKDIVRYTSYIAVKIPKLGKTIFINDREWESTFVCDKLVSEHDMITKSKKKFHEELWDAFHSVNYSEKKKEQWKLTMINLIFWSSFVRKIFQDNRGEIEQFFSNSEKYRVRQNSKELEEKYQWFPKTFQSLIKLLWWDKKCSEWWYVQALLESEEKGNQYLVEKEKNKLSAEEIREKFKSLDGEKINKRFSSDNTYRNNLKEIKKLFWEWMPNSFKGLITLLGGDNKCSEWWYVQALLESEGKGNEYLVEKEKNKLSAEEIREKFKSLDGEKINKRFSSDKTYRNNLKEIKKLFWEWMPNTFNGLITLLGGDNKCSEWWYVQALLESEEKGNEYLVEKEKNKLSAEEIREKFKSLDGDRIIKRFSSSDSYKNNLNEIKKLFWEWMLNTFNGLITLLGGDNKRSEWWYVQALLESEEKGNQYLAEKEKNKLSAEEIREKFKSLDGEKINKRFSSSGSYKNNLIEIKKLFWEWMPNSFIGLITLLGGDKKCLEWWYLQALLESEEKGNQYLVEKEKNKLSAEEIREKFKSLNGEKINKRFSSSGSYKNNLIEIKKLFWEWMPNSINGLITLLGGDNKCREWWYVQALLESEEKGGNYFEEYLKQKQQS